MNKNDSKSIQHAIDFIEDHLQEEVELSCIANKAHLSQAQLYRMFYALTGHPVKEYIRKRRMSEAANELRYSKRPIAEIAWENGFESYHSFAKVFKRIVGITPAAYRKAELIFSFEPIRLAETVAYAEQREQSEAYPDVKVIRVQPMKVFAYLHIASQEEGIEHAAFRRVFECIRALKHTGAKIRFFGYNVDLPDIGGIPRYGYRMLLFGDERIGDDDLFEEEQFPGGLYAVRKTPASSHDAVVAAWDRLLSDWLPKSTFDRGKHQYVEEFIAYRDHIARMHLYLPVERKLRPAQIEIVQRQPVTALFSRGHGAKAQAYAERELIAWYNRDCGFPLGRHHHYYLSFHYGCDDDEHYWWENGIAGEGLLCEEGRHIHAKILTGGLYASAVSKTYGLLTGMLDNIHRWIAVHANRYQLDEDRQWFAEYHSFEGTDIALDSIVKIYVPIK